ncbi:MAG: response regulator transcription factor [Dehalococcoidia bacterium]|nr:response regulator transcription factor [Dehalococcoidia bacterium]
MKVLIADDEKPLATMLQELLQRHNIHSDVVFNGRDAADYALDAQYDLIILDVMMPKMNGYEVIKEIRSNGLTTPVLFLSAKGEVEDKVSGLNLGADDYLTKPFAVSEFVARVRALTRRPADFNGDQLEYGDLVLDKITLNLRSKANTVKLSSTEYKIMEMLLLNCKGITEKERLIVRVWGYDNESEYNNSEVYISFLRKKLSAIQSTVRIKAVRGIGYTLISDGATHD